MKWLSQKAQQIIIIIFQATCILAMLAGGLYVYIQVQSAISATLVAVHRATSLADTAVKHADDIAAKASEWAQQSRAAWARIEQSETASRLAAETASRAEATARLAREQASAASAKADEVKNQAAPMAAAMRGRLPNIPNLFPSRAPTPN